MNRRNFSLAPPSFPRHYSKKYDRDIGWMYSSKYTNPFGIESILQATNEWFDYLGDIIMQINTDLEVLEQQTRTNLRKIPREKIRFPLIRKLPKLEVRKFSPM